MATKTKEEIAAEKEAEEKAKKEAEAKSGKVDYMAQIGGSLSFEKAKKIFGKRAVAAFNAVSEAGGYGETAGFGIAPADLAIPADNKELRAKINDALNNLD